MWRGREQKALGTINILGAENDGIKTIYISMVGKVGNTECSLPCF